ncbi:MAG: hypothetical protein ACYCW6_14955 [Candidatus Xenobia bacterium]
MELTNTRRTLDKTEKSLAVLAIMRRIEQKRKDARGKRKPTRDTALALVADD